MREREREREREGSLVIIIYYCLGPLTISTIKWQVCMTGHYVGALPLNNCTQLCSVTLMISKGTLFFKHYKSA